MKVQLSLPRMHAKMWLVLIVFHVGEFARALLLVPDVFRAQKGQLLIRYTRDKR